VLVSGSVEDHLRDSLLEAELGELDADLLGPVGLVPLVRRSAGGLLLAEIAGGDERLARQVVDDLRVDVAGAAEHHEARPFGRAGDALAQGVVPGLPALELGLTGHDSSSGRRLLAAAAASAASGAGLADLLLDDLFRVLHALALVRLGRPKLTDLRGRLAEDVTVGGGQDDLILLDLRAHALRQLEHDGVRVPE